MHTRIDGSKFASRQAAPGGARMRGMTTVGMIILVAFVGLFAFAAIKLTPVYLNYVKVAGVVEGVKEEFDGQGPSIGAIRKSIERRFSIEAVTAIEPREIKVTPDAAGFLVDASYSHTVHYIANVSFTVTFDKKVVVRR